MALFQEPAKAVNSLNSCKKRHSEAVRALSNAIQKGEFQVVAEGEIVLRATLAIETVSVLAEHGLINGSGHIHPKVFQTLKDRPMKSKVEPPPSRRSGVRSSL